MRKVPQLIDIAWKGPEDLDTVVIEHKVKIVTPLFGGGVALDGNNPHLKDYDHITPLRGSSVVGQIRFWWRAVYGARLASLAAMKERESHIFGTASHAGKVAVRVERVSTAAHKELPYSQNSALGYGAFALQHGREASDQRDGSVFQLSDEFAISWSVDKSCAVEVQHAVSTWLNLGGVGGRTRRGFGAVSAESAPDFATWSAQVLPLVQGKKTLPGVSALVAENIKTLRAGGPVLGADQAHLAALGKLRAFRQGEMVGRNKGQGNRPGRSFWPEPHAIRMRTRDWDPNHDVSLHTPAVEKFPRALFGMPIIFHFQSKTDPKDTQLAPAGQSRLASPVILRPVRVGGQWTAVCAVLFDADRENLQVELTGKGVREATPVEWRVTERERTAIAERVKPYKTSDITLSFLDYFAS